MNDKDILIEQLHIISHHDQQLVNNYIYYHNSFVIGNYILIMILMTIIAVNSVMLMSHNNENQLIRKVDNRKLLYSTICQLIAYCLIVASFHIFIGSEKEKTELDLVSQIISRNVNEDYFNYKLDKSELTIDNTQFELLDYYDNKVSDNKIIDYRNVAKFNWFIPVVSEDEDHYFVRKDDPLDMVQHDIVRIDKKDFPSSTVLE